ncbi:MAG: 2-hydroxychromene-2-carboxylate isomerase [Ideonella sp.]|jgi:carboxymethylenebutenolidase|nr:2-hydroxychromene-2-carboxylate isomerase [Ideonella sp.]
MTATIAYCFAPQSPWTYLGHDRFVALARSAGASVRVMPVDFGRIFPVSGGLPLPKRAPQRQAYRLVELRRFSEHLGMPLNLHPKFFPVAADPAARLILAVRERDGADAALAITGAVLRAVWAEERDIADAATLTALLAAHALPARRLDDAAGDDVTRAYDADTQWAVEAGVFGAPSYVVDGEIFWGQDRLDFLARRLGAPAA